MAGGSSTTSSTSHRSSRPWEGDTEGHAHIASSPAYHRSPLARTSQPHAFQGDMDFSDADFSRPHGQLAPSLHRNGREHRHVGMDSDEDDAMYDKRPRRENSNVSLGASLVCVLSTDSARFGSLDFTCIAPGGGRRQRRRVMMMMMIFRCALLSETRTFARHTSWAEHLRHISIQMRHAGAFARTHSRAHTLPRGASLPSLHSLAGAHRRAGAFLRSYPPVLRLDAHLTHASCEPIADCTTFFIPPPLPLPPSLRVSSHYPYRHSFGHRSGLRQHDPRYSRRTTVAITRPSTTDRVYPTGKSTNVVLCRGAMTMRAVVRPAAAPVLFVPARRRLPLPRSRS